MSGTRRLGRYEVGERVGSGGLAEVYVAHVEGAQGFRKRLVIKQLRSELHAHPEAFALLLAEAQLVQRLSHGNIVQVFDFGVDAQTPYLVMEHVDGISLADLLREARERDAAIDGSAALFVVESVCAALEYAHSAVDEAERPLGLVHRDVTPANVLLSREGLVKLTDFGIARLSAVGAEGRAIGTPGYRAPEQAAGEAVDRRADVYSLGVVIAELAERVAEGPLREALGRLAARAATEAVAERIADAGALGRELEALRREHAVPRGAGELAQRVRGVQRERRRVAQQVDAALRMRGPAAQTEALVGRPAGAPVRRSRARWLVPGLIAVAAIWAVRLMLDARVEPQAPTAGSLAAQGERAGGDEVAAVRAGAGEGAPRGTSTVGAGPVATPEPATSVAIDELATSTVSPARVEERPPRVRPVAAPGRLRVNVIPWAEASLDGAPIGRTPIDRRVAAGKHTLELRNPESGQRRAREIEVGRGGEVNITEW